MQRKLLHILLTLSLIALLFTSCKENKAGQSEPTTDTVVVEKQLINEPRWVTADPSLRLRDSAGSEGNIIGNIPLGEEVTLLEENGDELTIAGATGKWSRVKWQQLEGWVFGGFLTTEKPVVERVKKIETETPEQIKLSEIEKILIGKWIIATPSDTYVYSYDFFENGILVFDEPDGSFTYELNWKYENKKITAINSHETLKVILPIVKLTNEYILIGEPNNYTRYNKQ